MTDPVSYELADGIATITMDDGKVNALSIPMQQAIRAALDRAATDDAVVVLRGNAKVFCAGFDLATIREGADRAEAMVRGGFELAAAMLGHPSPIVIECTGHAMAMGVFLLLSGDHRIGGTGTYKVTANEVAIGLTMPYAAIALMHQRLTPAATTRAAIMAEVFTPESAVAAGFLDRLVDPAVLHEEALATARQAQALHRGAHRGTKERIRRAAIDAIQAALVEDARAFRDAPSA